MTQEVKNQTQALKKAKKQTDPQSDSDAAASLPDASPSLSAAKTSRATPKPQSNPVVDQFVLDDSLMKQIITELSDAKVLNSAISIRMSEEEKEFVDDFILVTLRKEKLQGHEVSIAKLMRYALAYLLLRHKHTFVEVLKAALLKKESGKLFQ